MTAVIRKKGRCHVGTDGGHECGPDTAGWRCHAVSWRSSSAPVQQATLGPHGLRMFGSISDCAAADWCRLWLMQSVQPVGVVQLGWADQGRGGDAHGVQRSLDLPPPEFKET